MPEPSQTLLSVCLALFLVDWWGLGNPARGRGGVRLGQLGVPVAVGLVLAGIFHGQLILTAGVLGAVVLGFQILCPHAPAGHSQAAPAMPVGPAVGPAIAPWQPAQALPAAYLPAYAQTPAISPYKRMWAFLLAMGLFMGFGGLHRIYVGKVFTGLVWLFTWGLLGIGQLVDVVRILAGQFTDKEGRPLLLWDTDQRLPWEKRGPAVAAPAPAASPAVYPAPAWTPSPYPQAQPLPAAAPAPLAATPRAPAPSAPRERGSLLAGLLTLLGVTIMFAAVLVGLAVAVNLPAIVAAGLPDPSLAKELEKLFGSAGWPALVDAMTILLLAVLMVIASVVLIIARSRQGGGRMVRAAMGAFGLLAAVYFLRGAMERVSWRFIADMANSNRDGLAMEAFFRSVEAAPAILAAVMLLVSIIVLCWPAARRTGQAAAPAGRQGVEP